MLTVAGQKVIWNETTHTETIKCPDCGHIEGAEVLHTFPWFTRIHYCTKCKYLIMESEWDKVETKN